MSDTGGGHRAAARAIQAALEQKAPGRFQANLVDMWKDYTPPPFNNMPTTYTQWVNNSPFTYGMQFWFNDHVFRLGMASQALCKLLLPHMTRFFQQHPADLYVCVHSVFVRPAIYARQRLGIKTPFVTVITDYALPTIFWYDPNVDHCCVPTEPAYRRGRALRVPANKMSITGAPIHPKFTQIRLSKQEARHSLGWQQEEKIVLLVGGGDGMGAVLETAQAIDQHALPCQLVIIAGRNAALKERLEKAPWKKPPQVLGFVENMPVLMRASDMLVTKAGPATITEAAAMGLPMIISGAIPYQETVNADYVVSHGAGLYAPGPALVADQLARILAENQLPALAEAANRLAQPNAVWEIAEELMRWV
jgi:1,2-diacylglycerol 3-beta-galactosyltransferase